MASEREQAKQSASEAEPNDPDLGAALGEANQFSVELIKEANRHREHMANGERGLLGRLLGGPNSSPTVIAFIIAIAGLAIVVWCLDQARDQGADVEFWSKQAERAFAFSGTAIGFIFGRGLK